mgnify:CR=1 FL=1
MGISTTPPAQRSLARSISIAPTRHLSQPVQSADRQGYLKGNLRDRYEELTAGSFVEADPNKDFAELTDGMIFDLGEVHVQAVAFPGHTAGSTAFLVEEDRLLITGDCCNNFTFLFGPEAAPVEAYRETVVQVRDRLTGRYDRIFVSHHGRAARYPPR